MSIKLQVDELELIQHEIKKNNARNKTLKARAKELEAYISEYMELHGQHGLKYRGRAILLDKKPKRSL